MSEADLRRIRAKIAGALVSIRSRDRGAAASKSRR